MFLFTKLVSGRQWFRVLNKESFLDTGNTMRSYAVFGQRIVGNETKSSIYDAHRFAFK